MIGYDKMTIKNAIRRIESLVDTAGKMQLDAKQRDMHKYEEEWETKRKVLEGALKILKEETK